MIQHENSVNPTVKSTIETMPHGMDNSLPPSSEKLPLVNAQVMMPLIASTPMSDMIFASRMVFPFVILCVPAWIIFCAGATE